MTHLLCVTHYLNQWWLVYLRIYASLGLNELTHWGWVTYICIGKLTIIGSDDGLSHGWHQAIIWTNAGILLIGPLGTNFSEILFTIEPFSFKKMHLKMSSSQAYKFYRSGSPLVQVIAYCNAHAYLKWGMMQILKTKTNKKKDADIQSPPRSWPTGKWHIYTYEHIHTHIVYQVNSLRPSDTNMHQYYNCHWFRQWLVAWSAPSHFLHQWWNIVNWTLSNKLQWNWNIFIQENAFESVDWKISVILPWPQCANAHNTSHTLTIAPILLRSFLETMEIIWDGK